MSIPVIIHRWFLTEGEAWAYHTSLSEDLRTIRAALSGQATGAPGQVGPVPLIAGNRFLVGCRFEDPDRPVDEFGRRLMVLIVAVTQGKPTDDELKTIWTRLPSLDLPVVPGVYGQLEFDGPERVGVSDWSKTAPPTAVQSLISSGGPRRKTGWYAVLLLGLVAAVALSIPKLLRVCNTDEDSSAHNSEAMPTVGTTEISEIKPEVLTNQLKQLRVELGMASSVSKIKEVVDGADSRLLQRKPTEVATFVVSRLCEISQTDASRLSGVLNGRIEYGSFLEDQSSELKILEGLQSQLLTAAVDVEKGKGFERNLFAIKLNGRMAMTAANYKKLCDSVESMKDIVHKLETEVGSESMLGEMVESLSKATESLEDSVDEYDTELKGAKSRGHDFMEVITPKQMYDVVTKVKKWSDALRNCSNWTFRFTLNSSDVVEGVTLKGLGKMPIKMIEGKFIYDFQLPESTKNRFFDKRSAPHRKRDLSDESKLREV